MFYHRNINVDSDDSLARLLRRISPGSKVLEIGPASGYCTRFLSETLGCAVDAVELSAAMAEHARPWCRRLLVGDIEQLDLAQELPGEIYDVILCADVIEHLRDPWSVLKRLAVLLAPEGKLLLSVPNIGYLGVLVDLLRGNFRYRDEGLLDRTHLRFFTIDSLQELLGDAGWSIWDAEQIPLSLTDSEFRVRIELLSPALRDELMARPDALCYQWVVEARPGQPGRPIELPARRSEDRFQVRVFWRTAEQSFDDSRNHLVWPALGREGQSIELRTPGQQSAIALRLSDRVGFIRLHRVSLKADDGEVLFNWTVGGKELPIASCHQIERADDRGLWFISGVTSLVELQAPLAAVARTMRVELVLDSPVSADFLSAKAFWTDPAGLPAQLKSCRAKCDELSIIGATLGSDASTWPSYARVVRLAKMIPGLIPLIDRLAAVRRALAGKTLSRR